jgi:hypothetical protein
LWIESGLNTLPTRLWTFNKSVTFGGGQCFIDMNIRTRLLQNAALLGLTASLLALPFFGAAAAGITFALTGVLAIVIADYGRSIEPLRVPGQVVPIGEPGRPSSDYREAA